jgi:large conductance mechanosensitive channel
MSLVKEFKEFAVKGNAMDLAIGVIIGAAFGKIISSLVSDIFMPIIGLVVGGMNFTGLKIILKDTAILTYGNFLQTTFDFLMIALCIFIFVKLLNTLKRKQEEAPAKPQEPSEEVKLLTEIRDALKNK